ncbi:MAG: hypothetical protein R6W69_00875 [Anaerolineales bacterium]
MRIDSNEKIADVSILTVRKFLRSTYGLEYWHESEIAETLKISDTQAALLREALRERGLIARAEDPKSGSGVYYRDKIEGNALAIASAAKPVSRKVAAKAFQEFMEACAL